uniref:Uncharacterized protein n=1 Tax=Anguilla anguilla TaxID=7936 RepID=A0A0E9SA04_ANGAN
MIIPPPPIFTFWHYASWQVMFSWHKS